MANEPGNGAAEAKLSFTPQQWIVYSAFDLAIHMLTGQASQLKIAGQDAPARAFLQTAEHLVQKRDKLVRQWQTGIEVVGPEVLDVLPEKPQ